MFTVTIVSGGRVEYVETDDGRQIERTAVYRFAKTYPTAAEAGVVAKRFRLEQGFRREGRDRCFVAKAYRSACGFRAAVSRAKFEIREDIAAGRVPAAVCGFASLHDYVDANGYGGAFEGDFDASDDGLYFWNAVQSAVDAWLKAGRPAA
jgi:hypothetical protein